MSIRAAAAVATVIVTLKAVLIGLAAHRWYAIATGEPATMHSMCSGWLIVVLAAAAGVIAAGGVGLRFASSQRPSR
jgi:hypothetical protein